MASNRLSLHTTPIWFARKLDRGMQLLSVYQTFNHATVKTWYPLWSIPQMLNRLWDAQIFTNQNRQIHYHLIWLKDGKSNIPYFALNMASSNTELYCWAWCMHQQSWKLISITVDSFRLMTELCAALIIFRSTQPIQRGTKSNYDKCHDSIENIFTTAKSQDPLHSPGSCLFCMCLSPQWNWDTMRPYIH